MEYAIIKFCKFKDICTYSDRFFDSNYNEYFCLQNYKRCTEENCAIWKSLEKIKGGNDK